MNDEAQRPAWQNQLQAHVEALSEDERALLGARALRALDRAAAAHPLTLPELAQLSALAGYLAQRLGRRVELPPERLNEALMFGLMAGFQLGTGGAVDATPGHFDE